MNINSILIKPESADDEQPIETMTEEAFGPGRFARSAFRLREGVLHEPSLSFTAEYEGQIIGSVRLTRILVSETPALLLGPLVVSPGYKGFGAGRVLMEKAVAVARGEGHAWIILVGDLPYYGKFGFEQVPRGSISLPAPVDPDRIRSLHRTELVSRRAADRVQRAQGAQ